MRPRRYPRDGTTLFSMECRQGTVVAINIRKMEANERLPYLAMILLTTFAVWSTIGITRA